MTSGIVDDHCMRDAVLTQFPSRETGALIARPCFVNPDVHRDAAVMGVINRRQSGAPIDCSEPTGITMGQHLHWASIAAPPPSVGNQSHAMLANGAAARDIRFGDLAG